MATFNWFGCVETDVAALFASAGYTAAQALADLGGNTVVDPVLNRMAREISEVFAPKAYQRLVQRVHGEVIVFSAKGGETTGTMSLAPAVANSVHLWRSSFARTDEMVVGDSEYFDFTVSGQIVTPGTPMLRAEYLYASYTINTEAGTFSMPSVADKVALGAAAELGERMYPDDTWPQMVSLRQRWATWKENAMENKWVPEEMRRMLFWDDIERASPQAGSIRFGRS